MARFRLHITGSSAKMLSSELSTAMNTFLAEADFVVTELGKPQDVIQVCYSDIEDANTREREVGGLIEALEYTGLKKGVILTSLREEKFSECGKDVEFIPLYKWLKTVS